MSDRAKAAYYVAALVAVFVLAWFVGGLAAPWHDRDDGPAPVRHDPPSDVPTEHPSHSA